LMLKQNDLFRKHGLGSFEQLLLDVTANPAMLVWLNGTQNTKDAPNENYGREMMELFTLGADRGAYTERDVREQARALTGWTSRWSRRKGEYDFHFDASRHDTATKTVFHKSGNYTWRDACQLCLNNPKHASFFTQKLWGYFIPVAPDAKTQRALEAAYNGSGRQLKSVLDIVLKHPALHTGPRMTKPPVVHIAGLLRRLNAGVTTDAWAWIGGLSGQQLFYPPNVAGWDDSRWLDTATFRGRWIAVGEILGDRRLDPGKAKEAIDAPTTLKRALAFWNNPELTPATHRQLLRFTQRALHDARAEKWKQVQYPVLVENALRHLIAVSPDLQTA
jgi:uncharacterized protein (DUF1800 family)